uniref:Neurotransmitter-gated ion-channel transmembrane domain-containing protein n=1 Tax=Strigamia maritima TaxID=126957 RepID=T1J1N1_STRMM
MLTKLSQQSLLDIELSKLLKLLDNYQPIYVDYNIYSNHEISQVNVPPEWTLQNITKTRCPFDQNVYGSCFSFDYHIRRNRQRTILLTFIPSSLIVILSWLSFWLEPTAAAPRVALGLTAMLTLTTQFSAAQNTLPAVSTIMALDVWMFACIVNVFASLVEYAIVNFINNLPKPKQKIRRKPGKYYSFLPPEQNIHCRQFYRACQRLPLVRSIIENLISRTNCLVWDNRWCRDSPR